MAIARMSGYQEFLSSDDFPGTALNGSWGVWDHVALNRMSDDMNRMAEPIHYGIFTLCTHSPWALPKGFVAPFSPPTPDAEILNTFAYLDVSLKEFFAREAMQARFKRTMYVIVGDHTTHASEGERFHVACIFYAQGRITPAADHRLMSHLDILPTILDLTGTKTAQASFGRSMLSHDPTARFAVMTHSNLVEWRRSNRTLVSDVRKDITLFNPDNKQGERINLLASEPRTADSLRAEFYAFYQTAELLIRNNRIYPSK
jgi:phosphoglycerol transferase MdoB-like AlkP superfamily enzyme